MGCAFDEGSWVGVLMDRIHIEENGSTLDIKINPRGTMLGIDSEGIKYTHDECMYAITASLERNENSIRSFKEILKESKGE